MKSGPLLFAASLALNAALLVVLFVSPHWRSGSAADSDAQSEEFSHQSKPSTGASGKDASALDAPTIKSSPQALATAFKSRDYAALQDQLRALGLSDATVMSMIRSLIWQPYLDRQLAINNAKASTDQPYWRGAQLTGRRAYTREERTELRQLASDLRAQMVATLGSQAFDATSAYSQRYAFLSPESAAKIADLDRDYGEMRQEVNQESEKFKVPSDAEKLKFLEKERRADLEATLTPAELEEYNLRYSPAAYALRSRLSQIDLSETEYRDLYDLQQAYYNTQADAALVRPQRNQKLTPAQLAQLQERVKTYDTLNQEIRQVLGDERYALYQRASDNDYRQLQAAADRFNIDTAVINQVYASRDAVSIATQQIASNSSLTPEQKKKALADLATETRQQVTSALGQEVGTAYLDKNMKWLDRVQSGNTFTLSPNTNRPTFRPIPKATTPNTSGRAHEPPKTEAR